MEAPHPLHDPFFGQKQADLTQGPRVPRQLTSAPTFPSTGLDESSRMELPLSKAIQFKSNPDLVSWHAAETAVEPTEAFYFNAGHATSSPGSVSSSAAQAWKSDTLLGFRNGLSPTESNPSTYVSQNPTRTGSFPELDVAASWSYQQTSPSLDDFDRQVINDELAASGCIPTSSDRQNQLGAFEDHYLLSYWTEFDPSFPIVHRPTFEMVGSSPIVKALMIAIGAQYHNDATALSVAVTLREVTSNLLLKVS